MRAQFGVMLQYPRRRTLPRFRSQRETNNTHTISHRHHCPYHRTFRHSKRLRYQKSQWNRFQDHRKQPQRDRVRRVPLDGGYYEEDLQSFGYELFLLWRRNYKPVRGFDSDTLRFYVRIFYPRLIFVYVVSIVSGSGPTR